MDIRNVQKTGNMFYAYLPTAWCRKYNIKPGSKISMQTSSDGTLAIFPHVTEKRLTNLTIDLAEDDQSILNKILVASYINPTSSFKINLMKDVDIERLLDQKKLISIEMVEFDSKHISCESSVAVEDPIPLLKTMVKKAKSMVGLIRKNYNKQLLQIYEDEIDRSKLLIEKSVINRLTFNETTSIKAVYLHYSALISKDLEKAADQIGMLTTKDQAFLASIEASIEELWQILEKISSSADVGISYTDVIVFAKKTEALNEGQKSNASYYSKLLVKQSLSNISEVLFDWSISHMVDRKYEKSLAAGSRTEDDRRK